MNRKTMTSFGFILIITGILIGLVLSSGLDLTNPSNATPSPQTNNNPVQLSDEQIDVLNNLSTAFNAVAENVNPSVVTIYTTTVVKRQHPFQEFFGDEFFRRFFQVPIPEGEDVRQGLGSGVIVGSDGVILTNNHVIENADDINIRLFDNTEYKAEVKGVDPRTDIAVLTIDADNLPAIKFGNSDNIRVGEWVLAVGSPLNPQLAHTVTSGIISAKGRGGLGLTPYVDFIQTDAAINPGNSGGALVNLSGELIGINSAIATRTGGFMGIGFAIPSNTANKVMSDILEKGRVVRGWLGIYIQNVTEELSKSLNLETDKGVIVAGIQEDSPAEKTDINEGDVVIALNGEPVENVDQLSSRIAANEPGSEVTLTILRNGDRKDIKVELGELPSEQPPLASQPKQETIENLGFQVRNVTPELRQQYNLGRNAQGVLITRIQPGSIAQRSGLQEGDLIMQVNRKDVKNVNDFNNIMKNVKKGDSVAFFIRRGGNTLFIAFSIPS